MRLTIDAPAAVHDIAMQQGRLVTCGVSCPVVKPTQTLRVVALLAREAGVHVLKSLLSRPGVTLACVAAHRFLPRAEGGGERPEWAAIERLCRLDGLALYAADDRATASDLAFLASGSFDLLVSVNWRYVLTPRALSLPRLGAINLHRGELPRYAGAEPVRRAIEAGEKEAVITAHLMTAEVDAGPTLATVRLPMEWDGRDSAAYAGAVRDRLCPLFAPLLDLAIAALVARRKA